MPDPIHQFEVHPIYPLKLFGIDASFTNSAAFMLAAIVLSVGFLMWAMRDRALVPGRAQSIAEITHEFVANMVRDSMGEQGMKFFPLIFTIFAFVFVCNMLGMIPIPGITFTVTSQIVVTAALALLVFATVLVVGFAKNGLHFLDLFVPSGVPKTILPFVVLIEVISFFSRPLSHAVRLFANMLGGHITLKVFAGFIIMLMGAGGWAALAPFPFIGAVALTALEVLVAFLQAYVFTMLTCAYLNDALHPGH
jgi:F-type H+-transporting ATPase subunit a